MTYLVLARKWRPRNFAQVVGQCGKSKPDPRTPLAGLYIVGAWLLLQIADMAFPALSIPEESIRFVWIALGHDQMTNRTFCPQHPTFFQNRIPRWTISCESIRLPSR